MCIVYTRKEKEKRFSNSRFEVPKIAAILKANVIELLIQSCPENRLFKRESSRIASWWALRQQTRVTTPEIAIFFCYVIYKKIYIITTLPK